MKNARTIAVLLIFAILASIAAGYVAGFFVYRDYKEKTEYFDKQTQFTLDKFAEMQDNLRDLYISLENTVDKNNIERKELLTKVETIKDGIHEWEKGYRDAIVELKETIEDLKVGKLTRMVENLQEDINGFKVKVQDLELRFDDKNKGVATAKENAVKVDLGKISVGKKEEIIRER